MSSHIQHHEVSDAKVRRQIIADSSDAELETHRQYALQIMHLLLKETQPGTTAHPDYAIWDVFVGEIEAERQKRTE